MRELCPLGTRVMRQVVVARYAPICSLPIWSSRKTTSALLDIQERARVSRRRGIDLLGGMGSSLCDLAMIDLVEGDVDGAWVRYERGFACYEEGGYVDHAAAARAMWDQAAAAS